MSSSDPLSRKLARFVVETNISDLSDNIVHSFKRSLLDFIGCSIAGMATDTSKGLIDYFKSAGSAGRRGLMGASVSLASGDAAFVNGAAAHAFDFDEGHTRAAAHPAAVIFPATFAAAEEAHASFVDAIAATVIGYDVMLRLSCAIHPESAKRGWHNTAVAGVFGAAASAAKLGRADIDTVQHALGIAASFTGGTLQFIDNGADTKRLHPGKAARDGLLSAGLAARNFRGPECSLDGKSGFLALHGGNSLDTSPVLSGLRERFFISESYFKPYPCNRHFHAAIQGLHELKLRRDLTADKIVAVEIGTYKAGVEGHTHTAYKSLFDAQSSLPFMASLVFLDNAAPLQALVPAMSRPDVMALASRIHATVNAACEKAYPDRRSAIVRVSLTDGLSETIEIIDPLGEPETPLSDNLLEAKFRGNCESLLGSARCESLINAIWNCETFPTCRELAALTQQAY